MPSMIRNGFMILCMGTCPIGILIPENANEYLYIPKIAAYSICFAPEISGASCDPRRAQRRKGVEQRFDSWWTGGSVDAE